MALLEVGAGGRSIPEALAAAVGPTGYVLATDINPAWLDPHGTYEVRRHDVVADPPPGTFDLVHARLVLVHVPDRARALATMVAALRPGGWLLVEDADTELQPLVCLDESGPAQRRANRLRRAFRELMTRRGADLRYGRTLPRTLREAGLVDVAAAGSFPVGGAVCDRLEIATMRQVRAELVAARLADEAEIDAHVAAVGAGELDLTLAPLISAWGRRPDLATLPQVEVSREMRVSGRTVTGRPSPPFPSSPRSATASPTAMPLRPLFPLAPGGSLAAPLPVVTGATSGQQAPGRHRTGTRKDKSMAANAMRSVAIHYLSGVASPPRGCPLCRFRGKINLS